MSQSVKVKVVNFNQLQNLDYPLKLDNYQRPYVWDKKKVGQLLTDLSEYSEQKKEKNYYLGTLLLHHDNSSKALFVIDGQQRLSTLAALYYHLAGRLPAALKFKYRSQTSVKNLQAAQSLMKEWEELGFDERIYSRLLFTIIIVDSEDLAFTFFDTQNNRGVPLKATDLLKAYHLRAIQGSNTEQDEEIQGLCARRWESVQGMGPDVENNRNSSSDFAPELFHFYLWRARNWRGQRLIERETHDDVINEFQARSLPSGKVDEVLLYPGRSNQMATHLSLTPEDRCVIHTAEHELQQDSAKLPFTIRQPIHKGIGFFLYAEKYAELQHRMFYQDPCEKALEPFRLFFNNVVKRNSHYLVELYKLCTLVYIDQFSYQRLIEFALWLDHVLGAIRLEKAYVFKEAPLKYLKESDHNLLDVISSAYTPQEVFDFMMADEVADGVYRSDRLQQLKIERGSGVRGRYLDAVLRYFGKEDIGGKEKWLNGHVKEMMHNG